MAQTERISYTGSAPSTEYSHGADIVAQSQSGNYSVVRVSATAYNRGNTSSFSNYQGSHVCSIDGYSGSASRSGTIPSGVATGAVRWDVSKDITVAHDSAGNRGAVTLRQAVSGWHTSTLTASFSGFPRIPKAPSTPGTPVVSEITETSVKVTWTASTDNGGSAIDGYLLRCYPDASGSTYFDVSFATTLSRVVTGLDPNRTYRFGVYARNGSYAEYSARTALTSMTTKTPDAPGTPVVSEILPTSVRVTWDAAVNAGGLTISGYLLRYWPNAEGTGAYTETEANNLTRVVTGLTPGTQYRFVVYARNTTTAYPYSPASAATVVRTLSGMWAKYLDVWRRTVPYVKNNGVWTPVSVFIKDAGVWKRGG